MWEYITDLGCEVAVTLVSIVVYLAVDRRLGARLVTLLTIAAVTNPILKNVFKMPRPPKRMFKVKAYGYGFPSGHAQLSTSVWGYLSYRLYRLYVERRRLLLLALSVASAIIVALVCISRVVLGVHWIHDVVGGVAFAVVTIAAVEYATPKLEALPVRNKLLLLIALSAAALAVAYAVGAETEVMFALSLGVPFLVAYELLGDEYKRLNSLSERVSSLAMGLVFLAVATAVYKSGVDLWVKYLAIAVCSWLDAYVVPVIAKRMCSR